MENKLPDSNLTVCFPLHTNINDIHNISIVVLNFIQSIKLCVYDTISKSGFSRSKELPVVSPVIGFERVVS